MQTMRRGRRRYIRACFVAFVREGDGLITLRKSRDGKGVLLTKWMRANRPMPPLAAFEKVKALTAELLPMADFDLRPLLRPDNLAITGQALALRSLRVSRRNAKNPPVCPGFSAPECHLGQAGPASAVYTVGAVLCTLLRGHPPPPANTRPQTGFPLFQQPNTLEGIVNFSTEPDPARRPPHLRELYDLLVRSQQRIYLDYQ